MYEQSIAQVLANVMLFNWNKNEWEHPGGSSALSRVHVYRHPVNNTYRIMGRQLQDFKVVINCAFTDGLKYNEATPTFLQFYDQRQMYGLNLVSGEDAEVFRSAVNTALKNLKSGGTEKGRQLRERDGELREMRNEFTDVRRQLQERDGQLTERDRQLREKDGELREIRNQLTDVRRQLQERDGQLRERDGQVSEITNQLTSVRGQLQEKNEEFTSLERLLGAKQREIDELERSLSEAHRAPNERSRHQTPDWVIPRDQIQLTEKCLGKGGWGSVTEGKYCGLPVAVKQIHELILSDHNRRLFEREMSIAARCRHPCMLQFIGATNDEGSPLFVTELMESSLRALLEQRPLSSLEVPVISLDVARALNYLHLKKPSPIIHRDISSANVLLWRQADQWRGKVSDYGTANVLQHTMTVGPGAIIYSAPEAHTKHQTVKVDVYSFGVLLCEICIRELPDPDRRYEQVATVTNGVLRALIRGCLQQDADVRPSMEDIVDELERPM